MQIQMSIFETSVRKECLDDTQPLFCSIINAENVQGHTEYVIRVQRGPLPENSWHVYKRFNEFLSLHYSLKSCGVDLPLPPKKLIGNFQRDFIAERRIGLQRYLDILMSRPILSASLPVKRFLDRDNYETIYQGLSLNHLWIRLRGEMNINIVKPLPQLGWRLRKQHFLVHLKSRLDPKLEFILIWNQFGPDKCIDDKQIELVLRTFCNVQHQNIGSIEMTGISEGGAWVIRSVYKNGTLLDLMYGVKNPYTVAAMKKYSSYTFRKTFSPVEVINITSQILQGLSYLHSKCIPYGHLHLGNILLEDGVVKLLDIENGALGLPCYYRSHLTNVKQVVNMQTIDVYCLGLVIYEMLFGEQLEHPRCFTIPSSCPPIFKPVLESILLVNNMKEGIPSISSLLNLEIFRCSPQKPQPYLKISSTIKQLLEVTVSRTIRRLKEDQSKVRQYRRSVKMEQILNACDCKAKNMLGSSKSNEKDGNDINANDKLGARSESPTSSVTSATSQGTVTPPAAASCFGEESGNPTSDNRGRSALLANICSFKKDKLRRVNNST